MRFWLSKNSAVPLREQLIAQIVHGIVSGDLKPEQRLPSTRELARRFRVHSNTISAAYRELAARGWVEQRKGSGVYVRPVDYGATGYDVQLDELVASFLRTLRERGFAPAEIKRRILKQLDAQPPDHFLVIEPDSELRRILVAEIAATTNFRVRGASLEDLSVNRDILVGAIPLALYGQAERVQQVLQTAAALPAGTNVLALRSRSIAESLHGADPPPADALIAIASMWPGFLDRARAVLVAAGLNADTLNFHDARQRGWQRGLRSTFFVIADSLTAQYIPDGCTVRVFPIIADSSLAELRRYTELSLTKRVNG